MLQKKKAFNEVNMLMVYPCVGGGYLLLAVCLVQQ